MDTSEIYINMCDKAKEIQLMHSIYEAGDIYLEGRDAITNRPIFTMAHENNEGKQRAIGDFKTWLPRQDQLQEMMGNYTEQCDVMYRYLMQEVLLPNQGIESMEQLWLKIVLREKYFKTWNSVDWTKQK